MVGEGVLHECILHEDVEEILVVGRKPCGKSHHKLKEVIHKDFFDLDAISGKLSGYNCCFFCLGVSSVGMKEAQYTALTHTLTLNFAAAVCKANPESYFCYVSGAGTDSTESGKSMWARVKGRTENDLVIMPFKYVYNFRPAVLIPTKGLKNTLAYYKYLGWLIPPLRWIMPKYFSTLKELGLAMINAVKNGYDKLIIEVEDIKVLARS